MKRTILGAVIALLTVGVLASPAGASSHKPPASCVRALTDGDQVIALTAEFAGDVQTFFTGVQQSAAAHSSGTIDDTTAFLTELTTHITTFTGQVTGLTGRLDPVSTAYRADRAACLAGRR
jgi:hypothetical protein